MVTILPHKRNIEAAEGENLLAVLQRAGVAPDAPCGGEGRCGKCRVMVDGEEKLACRTTVEGDMTVTVPETGAVNLLTGSIPLPDRAGEGLALAFDIGTTTVAGYLLAPSGAVLASQSRLNPQAPFGADVVSRIRAALRGDMDALTESIRNCVHEMALSLCEAAKIDPSPIRTVAPVGNPAMQQLFFGIRPENLAKLPFAPVLTEAKALDAAPYLPCCENAKILMVPDISGFVGADTVACVLATGLDKSEEMTLLVDIGTNGEMVLGNARRMVACSTAAGPALEGANISCGMRGQAGAIDHVRLEKGELRCSVIGSRKAIGICGSGLIDAVAAALDMGLLNARGRILNDDHILHLTDSIFLTQEDIRQVQTAKGAIAAGIELMAARLGIEISDIRRVYLAGAFGTCMDPASACRMGLLPPELESQITAVGNAAGSGAKLLALDPRELDHAQALISQIEFMELGTEPGFQRAFARNMRLTP